ncbi:MAG: GNAT family N-acetyltransferase, partial [Candidatus Methanofastidiosia archaeon]
IEFDHFENIEKTRLNEININLIEISKIGFVKSADIIYSLTSKIFENGFGFRLVSKEEMVNSFMSLHFLKLDKFIKIAFCKSEPIGYIIALPDLNKILKYSARNGDPIKRVYVLIRGLLAMPFIDRGVIQTIALKDSMRKRGVGTEMYKSVFNEMIRKTYKECETLLIDVKNKPSIRLAKKFNGRIHKEFETLHLSLRR